MHCNTIAFIALAVLLALVSAANTIQLINHCPYDIWYWSVGPGGNKLDRHDYDRIRVPGHHGSVTHGMKNTEELGGGLSLKIRDLPRYEVAPAGIIQVEYRLEPSKSALWYDLSAINCDHSVGPESPDFCPLVGGGIKLHVRGQPNDNCPKAWCAGRHCHNTYTKHGSWPGEPSYRCSTGSDIVIETCTEHAGPRTYDDDMHPEPLQISPDQTCGAATGFTCQGSQWGQCCSGYDFCGDSTEHCGAKCQPLFGTCPWYETPVVKPHPVPTPVSLESSPSSATASVHPEPLEISLSGECGGTTGYTCAGSQWGDCCSSDGFCGNSLLICNEGCVPRAGICFILKGRDAGPSMKSRPTAKATKTSASTMTRVLVSEPG